MAHVDPLETADVPDLQEVFATKEATLGYVPNSSRTLARWPDLARAYESLSRAIASTRHIDRQLRNLVFLMASVVGGCRYCQAHSAHASMNAGVEEEKLSEIWDFETSDSFSDAERAALRLAAAAGSSPPYVSDAHFEDLKPHFDDDAIVEIVGVIAFSGFMNRWNATMATELEVAPRATAERLLTPGGWSVGPHAPAPGGYDSRDNNPPY